jgi:hypothetical protein
MQHKIINTVDYLLIVDDSEIKEGDYYLFTWGGKQEIQRFKDQESDRENHEYLYRTACKKTITHLPLNNSPILEGVDLLPPYSRHQEDGLEELGNRMFRNKIDSLEEIHSDYILGVTEGYQVAREKYKYTEEDMLQAAKYGYEFRDTTSFPNHKFENSCINNTKQWLQSLQQPKMPVGFKCEMKQKSVNGSIPVNQEWEYEPKTTTNSQGLTQWVGEYIY